MVGLLFSLISAPAALSAEARVEEHYLLHCSGCHRADGVGVAGTTPSLHGLGTLLEYEGGRAYLGRVPGVAQAPLGDADLATLLNWMLERFSGAAPQPRYTGEEVARLRARPLRDPLAARAALEVRRVDVD